MCRPPTRAAILLGGLLVVCLYLANLVWFVILQADSSGVVAALSARGLLIQLRALLPGNFYGTPVAGMVLGGVMLWVQRRAGRREAYSR